MEPQLIADYACVIGEGPLWHPDERRLYWIDIENGRMFRYDPETGNHEQCYSGEIIGGFTIQADGTLLLFGERGSIRLWRDGIATPVIAEIPAERESRFNDVIADPHGRVFCGTMPDGNQLGRLYRLDPSGELTVMLTGIRCSNGMGFTPDRKHMYYTDSEAYTIYLLDYDEESGSLSNQRVFASNPQEEGLPDGMAVDSEGNIWSARWDGGCLVRYTADGALVERLEFPARKVSSVTFGGDGYSTMYITTAGGDKKETEGDGAGALFRIDNSGFMGRPPFRSRIGL